MQLDIHISWTCTHAVAHAHEAVHVHKATHTCAAAQTELPVCAIDLHYAEASTERLG